MRTYRLKDGGVVTANSPVDFLTKLRESSKFNSEVSNAEFMKLFTERIETYDGSLIRTDSPENFISDLISSGYIIDFSEC
jgi:predicted acetyltransferase